MNLRVFLVVHDLKREKVAKDLDVTYCYFNQIVRGKVPSKKLAKRISEYTKGEVTFDELRPKKMVDK